MEQDARTRDDDELQPSAAVTSHHLCYTNKPTNNNDNNDDDDDDINSSTRCKVDKVFCSKSDISSTVVVLMLKKSENTANT